MMNSYLAAMRNYATFSGRASRSQYWLFILVLFGLAIVALILDAAISTPFSESKTILGLTYLAHLLPNIAVTARRLHDTGHSGWWMLFFPVALFFLCQSGSPGSNAYGPAPTDLPSAQRYVNGDTDIPTARGPATQSNLTEELERLSQLRASGSLTDAEFEVMKSRVLANSR